jgi:hypothetical protein
MADSALQKEVEKWVISKGLPEKLGQAFVPRSLPLEWGGEFEFDGVSADGSVGVCVSTSSYKTSRQKGGSGKAQKIKADTLYLLFAKTLKRRILVFTEKDMLDHFLGQRAKGRFPSASIIELLLVQIPEDLAARLVEAKQTASSEVTPEA